MTAQYNISTHGVSFNGQDRCAAPEDGQLILLGLAVEDRPARQGDDTDLEALIGQFLRRLQDDADFASSGDECEVLLLDLVNDVTALERVLERGVFEVGKVLTGETENRGGLLASESAVVSGRGLIAISGAPNIDVGGGTEVEDGLDRLVGRAVFTETNRVVSSNPDDLMLAESR